LEKRKKGHIFIKMVKDGRKRTWEEVRATGVTKINKVWSKRRWSWRNEQKKRQGKCISGEKY